LGGYAFDPLNTTKAQAQEIERQISRRSYSSASHSGNKSAADRTTTINPTSDYVKQNQPFNDNNHSTSGGEDDSSFGSSLVLNDFGDSREENSFASANDSSDCPEEVPEKSSLASHEPACPEKSKESAAELLAKKVDQLRVNLQDSQEENEKLVSNFIKAVDKIEGIEGIEGIEQKVKE